MIQVESAIPAGRGMEPSVTLTGTRSAIPDQVAVFRDGVRIATLDGVDVFTGTDFAWTDWGASMGSTHTYRVAPIVNGNAAKGGPTTSVTPHCTGVWLIDAQPDDPQDPARAVLWNVTVDQSQPETAIEHDPITGATPHVVRRRLVRLPLQGSTQGQTAEVPGIMTSATSEAVLRSFADNDAGHLYRLVFGRQSPEVIIGNLAFTELEIGGTTDPVTGVTFDWWGR